MASGKAPAPVAIARERYAPLPPGGYSASHTETQELSKVEIKFLRREVSWFSSYSLSSKKASEAFVIVPLLISTVIVDALGKAVYGLSLSSRLSQPPRA